MKAIILNAFNIQFFQLTQVSIKYLKSCSLSKKLRQNKNKKKSTWHARKRTLNIYTSFYGAGKRNITRTRCPGGAQAPTGTRTEWIPTVMRGGCNHFGAYSFNGNDNCWVFFALPALLNAGHKEGHIANCK